MVHAGEMRVCYGVRMGGRVRRERLGWIVGLVLGGCAAPQAEGPSVSTATPPPSVPASAPSAPDAAPSSSSAVVLSETGTVVSAQKDGLVSTEPIKIGADLTAIPIAGVPAYVIRHDVPIAANSLVFLTPDGIPVLADTPWTPTATQTLLDWVERQFGRRPQLATVSHFHHDASGGTATLQAAGVTVVSSKITARLVTKRSAGMQAELVRQHGDAFVGWSVPPSDRQLAGAQETFEVGGTPVVVLFPGAAHAPGNVVTWFPQFGLLFGGCLVKGGKSLGYLGDANLTSYPAAVDRLIALSPKIVVSGHGSRLDPGQLENTRRLLDARAAKNVSRK